MSEYAIPKGWHAAGSHPSEYWMGVDPSVSDVAGSSATLKAKVAEASGFGTLMQMILANEYRGKRIRFSANVKGSDIGEWAGLWMRVDAGGRSLQFDNMQDRAVKGTTGWSRHDVVLDVPEESDAIAFGVLLSGTGQVWINAPCFEPVGEDVPTTSLTHSEPLEPVNLELRAGDA
ncbi:MAG: hypothetical protein COZ06_06600 [Armatimonadetes bacterium CG_4_10_14_3_um_filter_66_18]|nr:hypothetical protein [Armatimonadota bacterium]OIP06603.1 MAG: hypothetical protein AUJ96_08745 [Armatimonadetes bacterium CG2_30_66_41]PIU92683.1 MAG: hypothetical protein COS65_16645 [Armatimonadetes bacterium CG06_land_8_20_14_3_00_66_21]PIW12871.1 MAG: hypothetical protein COW34_12780 [Armatimonadetes bacterium CG17_big_fil_post_rev_8_21_14_2_50_66_6]PIX36915.1 MAG: hypothetical protein COZ57_37015 [Armatimonadetes bacterium CG_4_8_14_3_um_filter_66_20]PIY50972.1 MAG: hypothetical prote